MRVHRTHLSDVTIHVNPKVVWVEALIEGYLDDGAVSEPNLLAKPPHGRSILGCVRMPSTESGASR
jgi:hypothetical protein